MTTKELFLIQSLKNITQRIDKLAPAFPDDTNHREILSAIATRLDLMVEELEETLSEKEANVLLSRINHP